jgi:hypothetical protein
VPLIQTTIIHPDFDFFEEKARNALKVDEERFQRRLKYAEMRKMKV